MKPTENALKVAEALESGEFKQARGALRSKNGFCCLGVACEMHRRETGAGRWTMHDEGDKVYRYEVDGIGMEGILPYAVAKWLGFATTNGGYTRHHPGDACLSSDNDRGIPFSSIAQRIREDESLYN